MTIHIVLVEPEIPANTGNIARTCACTGMTLHLVHPLGFSTADRMVKRAGLDYWDEVEIFHYDSWTHFASSHQQDRLFFATTKADRSYTDVHYHTGDYLVFGPETRGLPETLLAAQPAYCIRIPMRNELRSLNLSNAVAIAGYEALRQVGFANLT